MKLRGIVLIVLMIAALLGVSYWIADPPRDDGGSATAVEARPAGDQPLVPEAASAGRERPEDVPRSPARESAAERLVVQVVVDGAPGPAGATVKVLPWNDGLAAEASTTFGLGDRSIGEAIVAMTDAAGRASFGALAPPAFVAVGGSGLAPAGRWLEATPDVPFVIETKVGQEVEGLVLREGEAPFPNARVVGSASVAFQAITYGWRLEPERIAGMLMPQATLTDDAGRFRLSSLPILGATFTASHDGYAPEVCEPSLPLSEPLEIVLSRAATVRGLVLDARTAAPVAGAYVAVFVKRGDAYWVDVESGTASTGADGRFEVPAPIECARTGLRVHGDGYAVHAERLVPLAYGERRDTVVRLDAEVVLRGTVRSDRGLPVDEVYVKAWRSGTNDWVNNTRTNARGEFGLGKLTANEIYHVFISKKGYEGHLIPNVSPHELEEPVEWTLDTLHVLTGTVVAEGDRLARASVRAVLERDGTDRAAEKSADVSEDGQFALEGLVSGVWRIDAFAAGFAPTTLAAVPVGGEGEKRPDLEIRLERGRTLVGTVVDAATNAPVATAKVALADLDHVGYAKKALPVSCVTDDTGTFRLEGAPKDGTVPLLIEHADYAPEQVAVNASGQVVRLFAPATLDLAVREQDGRNVRDVVAYVLCDRAAPIEKRSDTTGRALVKGLRPGRADVIVEFQSTAAVGFQHVEREIHLESGRTHAVEISLAGGARIHGKIVSQQALKWEDLYEVCAIPEEGQGDVLITYVEPDRTYALASVPPGRYRLRASERNRAKNRQVAWIVEVQAGQHLEIDFSLADSGFRGRLTDEQGRGVAVGRMTFERVDVVPSSTEGTGGTAHGYARSNDDGTFEVIGLEVGRYRIDVRARGFGDHAVYADVPDHDRLRALDLTLAREAIVEIHPLDEHRGPVDATSELTALHPDPTPRTRSPGARDRVITYHGLAAGPYRLRVDAEGRFPWTDPIALEAGETRTVRATLRPRADVTVQVKGATGGIASAVPSLVDLATGTQVAAWIAEGLLQIDPPTGRTDDEGFITFFGVPAGRYAALCEDARRELDVLPAPAENRLTLFLVP